MLLFETKTFTMHSGDIGHWKIECDALSQEDIETLCFMIAERFDFYGVYGIPTGATRIAEALEKYADPESNQFLIVDDVLTTGNSMNEARENLFKILDGPLAGPKSNPVVIGVVLFSRTQNVPSWISPLFQLWGKPNV